MLDPATIDSILARLSALRIGVVGDLFLDQYLRLDDRLTEPSLETGLPALQVTGITNSPGAAGTVLNNLSALGVGTIKVLSCIGRDGAGWELKDSLADRKIDTRYLLEAQDRFTPTYIKPMLHRHGEMPREQNRLDIRNRSPTPAALENQVMAILPKLWNEVDALLISDQVSEPGCGVITARVRELLIELGQDAPTKLLLVDSRENIGLFRSCWTKPNAQECRRWHGISETTEIDLTLAVIALAAKTGRPVFCTAGEGGILLADPSAPAQDSAGSLGLQTYHIPAYPVAGPIDPVGAGDAAAAGIACAYAAGATLAQAAAFGNLVASITVQQLGTTGAATPEQIRQRWKALKQPRRSV